MAQDLSVSIILEARNLASGAINQLRGEFEGLSGSADRAGSGLSSVAGMAAAGFGLAIGIEAVQALGSAFEGIITGATHFQTVMNQVQQNTGMTTAETTAMGDEVLALSDKFGVTTDKIAEGYAHVMNITHDAAAAQGIMNVSLESAVATGADAAQVANVLTNAMHEYGLDSSAAATEAQRLADINANAAHVMGIMHIAAQDANMTLTQFSDVSGRAIGMAAGMKIPMEDVATAIADLTKHGFDAAGAGVQVTDMLTHLIKPTAAATEEFKRLSQATGVDLVGDLKLLTSGGMGLAEFLDQLHLAYTKAGLSEAQFAEETFKLIAAQRGGLGMNALLTTGYEDFGKILGDVSDQTRVNTVTEQGWIDTQKTAGEQWNILTTSISNAGIVLGSQLLPALTPVIAAMAADLPDALSTAGDAFNTLGGIAGDIFGTLKSDAQDGLQFIADRLTEAGRDWAPWAAQAGSAGTLVDDSLTGVSEVVQGLQFLLQGNFKAAWQDAQAAMGEFAGGGTALKQVLDDNRNLIIGVGAAFASWAILGTIVPIVLGVVGAIADLAAGIAAWIAVMGPVEGILGVIVALLGGPLTIAVAAVALAVGALAVAWLNNWGDIQGKTETVVAAFSDSMAQFQADMKTTGTKAAGLRDDINAAFDPINANIDAASKRWGVTLNAGWDQDRTDASTRLGMFRDTINGSFDTTNQDFTNWVTSWTAILKSGWDQDVADATTNLGKLGSAIDDALQPITSKMEEWARNVRSTIGGAFSALGSAVSYPNPGGIPSPSDSTSDFSFGIQPFGGPLAEGGTGSGGSSGGAIVDIIREAAIRHGIDPDVALRVAMSEGGTSEGARPGDKGSSFGPFQLHYGGVATGGNAVSGLGDTFTAQTGLDARNPANVAAAVDFAMAQAAQSGWGGWHGAPLAGVTPWMGIGTGTGEAGTTAGSGVGLHDIVPAGQPAGTYQNAPGGANYTPIGGGTDPASVAADANTKAAAAFQKFLDTTNDQFVRLQQQTNDKLDSINATEQKSLDANVAKYAPGGTADQAAISSAATQVSGLEQNAAIQADTSARTNSLNAQIAAETAAHQQADQVAQTIFTRQQSAADLARSRTIEDANITANAQLAADATVHNRKLQDQQIVYDNGKRVAQEQQAFELAMADATTQAQKDALQKRHDAAVALEQQNEAQAAADLVRTRKLQDDAVAYAAGLAATALQKSRAQQDDNLKYTQASQDAASQHARAVQEADLAFTKAEQQKSADLANAIAAESLKRQVDAINKARDAKIAQDAADLITNKANIEQKAQDERDAAIKLFDENEQRMRDAAIEKATSMKATADQLNQVAAIFSAGIAAMDAHTTAVTSKTAQQVGIDFTQSAQDISKALGITDLDVEKYADKWQIDWDTARIKLNDETAAVLGLGTAVAGLTDKTITITTDYVSNSGTGGPIGQAAGNASYASSLAALASDTGSSSNNNPSGNASPFDPSTIGSSGPGGKYNDPSTGQPYTHAAGGVTTGPVHGVFGEAGPEAIIPLADYFVSHKSAGGAGGSGKLTREDARMIAEELAAVMKNVNLSVGVDTIHSALLQKARRGGTMGLA
jgi:TP901 family phage tail tape measure protein